MSSLYEVGESQDCGANLDCVYCISQRMSCWWIDKPLMVELSMNDERAMDREIRRHLLLHPTPEISEKSWRNQRIREESVRVRCKIDSR